jgi:hypothetical protein
MLTLRNLLILEVIDLSIEGVSLMDTQVIEGVTTITKFSNLNLTNHVVINCILKKSTFVIIDATSALSQISLSGMEFSYNTIYPLINQETS